MQNTNHWRPKDINNIYLRAKLLKAIRVFFAQKNVTEVETPLLSYATNLSPQIQSFRTKFSQPGSKNKSDLYLQTSPEFAMKRLLASGSGDIYQICKAFRDEEQGRLHNPEFTMLEWYRLGFNHHRLMDELAELLNFVLCAKQVDRLTYQAMFMHYLGIDPLNSSIADLLACAQQHNLNISVTLTNDYDVLLQLLLTHLIEPNLGIERPIFIYDFPVSQAALAKISTKPPFVAERFELYINGIELANGFHELTDPNEQRQRFLDEQSARKAANLPILPIDERLLAALSHLPPCAGVALGVDRLLLVVNNANSLDMVLNFPVDTA